VRAHVSSRPISLPDSESAGLHALLYVPTLIASPTVTNRMIQSAAILIGERALSAKRRKARFGEENGAGAERVSDRANQTTH
jgi:hypothetical protein